MNDKNLLITMINALEDPFNSDELQQKLKSGLVALELNLADQAIKKLLRFINELHHWNQAYSLTAIRDPLDMVARHLLDSLSATPFVIGENILDIGCGAGLPGIPLSLIHPNKQFYLLDSNKKKQLFVEHVCRKLNLTNVHPVQIRIENFNSEHQFDTIICRALASLKDFANMSTNLLNVSGQLVALKGKLPESEISSLPSSWNAEKIIPIRIPMLDGERNIVVIKPIKI
ncbi:MAG: 16S rRNA (guanine(527)-N(7))-methyltransferase RsmG [Pseudomonadota bacterium]|nr:16S rRNA (guanine(527)-N(7))-methyltransferase RsmG [Pseudomonadota bacterium]